MEIALSTFFDREASGLVSVRRKGAAEVEGEVLHRKGVAKWVQDGSVRFLGTGEEHWAGISSTRVRESVITGDRATSTQLVVEEIAQFIEHERLYQ